MFKSAPTSSMASKTSSSSSSTTSMVELKYTIAARPTFPGEGIAFDSTWEIVTAMENRVNQFMGMAQTDDFNVDAYHDHGCLTKLEPFFNGKGKPIVAADRDHRDYALFKKYLGFLRHGVGRIERKVSKEVALDAHMGMGRLMYFHKLFQDALDSFKRSSELERTDALSHLWAGNCLCLIGSGRYREAREEYLWAHEIAEVDQHKWDYLLPHIHVNLGIAYEMEGLVSNAIEHYSAAAAFCPQNLNYLRLLSSALIQTQDYIAAEKVLEEASSLRADHADTHFDLGRVFHATGRNQRAVEEYRRAVELKPGHVNAMYHLGVLFMEMDRYRMASAMFAQVTDVSPIHWRALLNKAVALSCVLGGNDETTKCMNEAFEMVSDSVESRDMMIAHIKQLQKKAHGGSDERIKDVLAEVYRSYVEFIQGRRTTAAAAATATATTATKSQSQISWSRLIQGRSGVIIPNTDDTFLVTTAPPTNRKRVLSRGSKRSKAKQ